MVPWPDNEDEKRKEIDRRVNSAFYEAAVRSKRANVP